MPQKLEDPAMAVTIDESWYERAPDLPERVSAGGVVVRIDGGNLFVALIRERDQQGEELLGHVLPKGQVHPEESVDAAALREIAEEAGLSEVEKVSDLAVLERRDLHRAVWSLNHIGLYYSEQVEADIQDTAHHFDFGWFPLESPPAMFWPDERELLLRERLRIYDQIIARQNPKPRKKYFM